METTEHTGGQQSKSLAGVETWKGCRRQQGVSQQQGKCWSMDKGHKKRPRYKTPTWLGRSVLSPP